MKITHHRNQRAYPRPTLWCGTPFVALSQSRALCASPPAQAPQLSRTAASCERSASVHVEHCLGFSLKPTAPCALVSDRAATRPSPSCTQSVSLSMRRFATDASPRRVPVDREASAPLRAWCVGSAIIVNVLMRLLLGSFQRAAADTTRLWASFGRDAYADMIRAAEARAADEAKNAAIAAAMAANRETSRVCAAREVRE